MGLLAAYSYRNLLKRKLTSALTLLGVALVVFVFCAVLMLSNGLNQTLVDTGSEGNAIVIRKASQTEVQSILTRGMAHVIRADPGIARSAEGTPLIAGELLVLITQNRRATDDPSNVPIRGISPASLAIRPHVVLSEGRMNQPGKSEIIAGRKAAETFQGCGLGETIRFASRDWTVVGIFEADGSGFESELWGDYDQLSQAFQRPMFSSLTMKLASRSAFDAMKTRLESDPRVTVDVRREKEYYAAQSTFTRTYINVLGTIISIIFSMGAIVGAMITMYASVAGRTPEIGTLRALGFSRFTVLRAFLMESVLIAALGGALGILAALALNHLEVSTMNWDTFAELAFGFRGSTEIVVQGFIFALVMGLIGGFLPAVRAAQLRIIAALRAK
jgi:ABC-type lipoprotein release transport system permease subunit